MKNLISGLPEQQNTILEDAHRILSAYSMYNNSLLKININKKEIYSEDVEDFIEIDLPSTYDLTINKNEYEVFSEAIEYLYNSGIYLSCFFNGKEMIVVDIKRESINEDTQDYNIIKQEFKLRLIEKYLGEEINLKKYNIGKIAILTKNSNDVICDYCEECTNDDHYSIIERIIENNELKIIDSKISCKHCKELFIDGKINECGPF